MSNVQKTAAPLADALQPEEVSTSPGDLARFEIDGVGPSILVRPRSTEGLCDVMRIAQETRLAVIPVGSGSGLASFNVPARYDAALSLEHFSRVLEYDPDNSFVRVEAGCTLGALEETLANKGQRVRLDFPSRSARTVGGLVSRPFVGARYPFFGAPRDVALGLAAVLPGGKLTRPGGVTAKNVAGYDLTRLFVGSGGSLAVITKVNLRTVPLPVDSRAIDVRFADLARAFEFARAMAVSRLCPSFLTVLCRQALEGVETGDASSARVLVGAEGFEKDVTSQLDHFRSAASSADAVSVSDELPPYRDLLDEMSRAAEAGPEGLVVRVSAPMTELNRFASICPEAPAIAFVPAGVIVIRAPEAGARRVLAEIDAMCGRTRAHRHVVAAPAELKCTIDVWSGGAAPSSVMRAIKNQFDPAGVLSPGRMPGLM